MTAFWIEITGQLAILLASTLDTTPLRRTAAVVRDRGHVADGGDRHAVALRNNGTVRAWGENVFGQSKVPAGLRDVIAVSAGENHTLALLDTGRVVAWGANTFGQVKVPPEAVNIVQIAAGRRSSLAVKSDGTLVTWGEKTYATFPNKQTNKRMNKQTKK